MKWFVAIYMMKISKDNIMADSKIKNASLRQNYKCTVLVFTSENKLFLVVLNSCNGVGIVTLEFGSLHAISVPHVGISSTPGKMQKMM